jgi:FixJ family two-component response regulator
MTSAVPDNGCALAVAIVEDDLAYRRSLGRLCRVLGFTTMEFASGAAFLEAIDGLAPRVDCLLVDKMMPWMTGLELHGLLVERGLSLPTILITGDADAETRARCVVAGVAACLEKPIDADTLLEVVPLAAGRVTAGARPDAPSASAQSRGGRTG